MEMIEDNKENEDWKKVLLARNIKRFHSLDIINYLFEDFIELHGDRGIADDKSMVCGIAMFDNNPVTIISQQKGSTHAEMEYRHYGMTKPEGYRKSLRLMRQAEKFCRPIICFIDTPGAYPGLSAEENGQAEAIARNLFEMSNMKVPIISIIIGEGGSGGALAIGVANKVIMLENAIYSVVSPEGCASILCKDSKYAPTIAKHLKLTAKELRNLEIIDDVISEEGDVYEIMKRIQISIAEEIEKCKLLSGDQIKNLRNKKFRKFGENIHFVDEVG